MCGTLTGVLPNYQLAQAIAILFCLYGPKLAPSSFLLSQPWICNYSQKVFPTDKFAHFLLTCSTSNRLDCLFDKTVKEFALFLFLFLYFFFMLFLVFGHFKLALVFSHFNIIIIYFSNFFCPRLNFYQKLIIITCDHIPFRSQLEAIQPNKLSSYHSNYKHCIV